MYAIYLNSSLLSGAEKRALKICYHLNDSGISCKILMSSVLFNLLAKTEYEKYLGNCVVIDNILLCKLQKIKRLRLIRKYTGFNMILKQSQHLLFRRIIKKNKISVLHVFLSLDFELMKSICSKESVKILFEITSPDWVENLSKCSKLELSLISHFNAVSGSTYSEASKFISKDRLSQAPIPFFSPIEYQSKRLNILDQKEQTIIFAHRLIPRKNGILFAEVVKSFLQHEDKWKIKIFGTGPQENEINNILSEEIEAGKVVTGYRKNILPELEHSKIFVSLIEPDNYPSQSVMEAMYMGNSVLLSNEGETKEKFLNENGLLCEIEFEDILNKLLDLVKDEERLAYFCQNSIDLVKSRFDQSIYLEYLHQTYQMVNG